MQQFLLHPRVSLRHSPVEGRPHLGIIPPGGVHTHHRTHNDGSADKGLAVIGLVALHLFGCGVAGIQIMQETAPLCHAGRVGVDPGLKTGLLGTLGIRRAETLQAGSLALLHFTHIAQPEIGVRILEPYSGIGLHPLLHYGHLLNPQPVGYWKSDPFLVISLHRRGVPVSPAGIAYHHGEVTGLISFQRYFQPADRPQRHIVPGIIGRASVRSRVDAVHCEIAFLLRPFPVVDITAESGDADRWGGDETQVRIYLIQRHIILFSGPH